MSPQAPRSVLARGLWFFGFWLLLAGPWVGRPGAELATDLVVGILASAWAAWVSLRLLPPVPGRLRWGALGRLAVHFIWQSIIAGVDVALRAFHPRLPLHPGFLAHPVGLPPGPARSAFGAFSSLMPGTLPVGTDSNDALVYHCLDLDQPVGAGLARDEALLAGVRAEVSGHD
jgi:multicomponent Na+:H+ antiporter subunit E